MIDQEELDRQEYLVAVRKLMALQGNAAFVSGSNSAGDKGDSMQYIPQMLVENGIEVPAMLLREYKRITGVDFESV